MYPILKRCFQALLLSLVLFKAMAQDTSYLYQKFDYMPKVVWAQEVFKCKVKEAFATSYRYLNDSMKHDGFTKWKFNEYGQMTNFSWQIIGYGKTFGDSTTYRFNDHHLLEEVKVYNDVTDELYRTTRYTYLKDNRLKFIHEYDKQGHIRDSTIFNYVKDTLYPVEVLLYRMHSWVEEGKSINRIELFKRHRCSYDAHNNLVWQYDYDGDGKFHGVQNWLYDKNDHCIQESTQLAGFRKFTYAYDVNQQGFKSRRYEVKDGRRVLHTENRYEGDKLVYKSICDGKMLYSEEEWKYDAMGNEIFNRNVSVIEPVKETSSDFKYDKNGNFTRLLITVNKVPETLEERVLVYY